MSSAERDIARLSGLDTQKVLGLLSRRYANAKRQHDQGMKPDQIYTRAGPVVVALNPFSNKHSAAMAKLYSEETQEVYALVEDFSDLPPHLYEVAAKAYNGVRKENGRSQAVVINGESGAGKTEAVKIILDYFTKRVASAAGTGRQISELLLSSSPALEAFGNAKTLRNDNSSRFGKYVRLHFGGASGDGDRGALAFASVEKYLLETPRVVFQARGEQAYHAFYFLMRGCSDAPLREQCDVGASAASPKAFSTYVRMPEGGGGYDASFQEADESLTKILLAADSAREPANFWRVIAGLMHLGEVRFEAESADSPRAVVTAASRASLKKACELLATWGGTLRQLNEADVDAALCVRVIKDPKKHEVKTPRDKAQALKARDALAKAVYAEVFTELVSYVNRALKPKAAPGAPLITREKTPITPGTPADGGEGHRGRTIGLLDIFGSEIFEDNSLSQLLINYANDKLQLYFTDIAVKAKADAFRVELDRDMTPDANQDRLYSSLAMLEGERPRDPHALFCILNDIQIFEGNTKQMSVARGENSPDAMFADMAFKMCGRLTGYITGGKETRLHVSAKSRWVPNGTRALISDMRAAADPLTWCNVGTSPPVAGAEISDDALRERLVEKATSPDGTILSPMELKLDQGDWEGVQENLTRLLATSYVKIGLAYYQPKKQYEKGKWAKERARKGTPNDGAWRLVELSPTIMSSAEKATFGVDHFGGPVFYNVDQFVARNFDKLDENLAQVLGQQAEVVAGKASASAGREPVSMKFMVDMGRLDEMLRQCDGHFVRCIKPNTTKGEFLFDEATTQSQLEACGVVYAAQVSQAGYMTMPLREFLDHRLPGYALPGELEDGWNYTMGADALVAEARTLAIDKYGLEEVGKEQVGEHLPPEHFIMGRTMIFLKQSVLERMHKRREERLREYDDQLRSTHGEAAVTEARQMRDREIATLKDGYEQRVRDIEARRQEAQQSREGLSTELEAARGALEAARVAFAEERRLHIEQAAIAQSRQDADATRIADQESGKERLEREMADLRERLTSAETARDTRQGELTAEQGRVRERDTTIGTLTNDKAALEAQLRAAGATADEQAQARMTAAREQEASLAQKDGQVREEMSAKEAALSELETERRALRELRHTHEQLEALKDAEAASYDRRLQDMNNSFTEVQEEKNGLSAELAQRIAELSSTNARLESETQAKLAVQVQLESERRGHEATRSQLAIAESGLANVQEMLRNETTKVGRCNGQLKDMEDDMERMQIDFDVERAQLIAAHEEELLAREEAAEDEKSQLLDQKDKLDQALADASASEESTLVSSLGKFSSELCKAIKMYRSNRRYRGFSGMLARASFSASRKDDGEAASRQKEREEFKKQYKELNDAVLERAADLEKTANEQIKNAGDSGRHQLQKRRSTITRGGGATDGNPDSNQNLANARECWIEARIFHQISFALGHEATSCLKMINALKEIGFIEQARAECIKLERANQTIIKKKGKMGDDDDDDVVRDASQFVLWDPLTDEEEMQINDLNVKLDELFKAQFKLAVEEIAQTSIGREERNMAAAAPLKGLPDLKMGNLNKKEVVQIGVAKHQSSYVVDLDTELLQPLLQLAQDSRKYVSPKGLLTPMEEIVAPPDVHDLSAWKKDVKIDSKAVLFCFAFPLPGIDRLEPDSVKQLLETGTHAMCFAINGGFVYFDTNSKIVGIKPVVNGLKVVVDLPESPEFTTMRFGAPVTLPNSGALRRTAELAARPPTILPLIESGIQAFTWLSAKDDTDGRGNSSGMFAYLYGLDESHKHDCYFCVTSWSSP